MCGLNLLRGSASHNNCIGAASIPERLQDIEVRDILQVVHTKKSPPCIVPFSSPHLVHVLMFVFTDGSNCNWASVSDGYCDNGNNIEGCGEPTAISMTVEYANLMTVA